MGNPSIEYAEDKLGVHSVYENAQTARDNLVKVASNLAEARNRKRQVEGMISDLEFEIVAYESGENPGMSQAAMDRHLKVCYSKSEPHATLRRQLRETSQVIDEAEAQRSVLEADIRIGSSRLVELGGYLQYLAAVKMARPRRTHDTSDTSATEGATA